MFLLQHNQKEALSPGELQDKIMDMMKTNPDIAEAVSIQLSFKVAPSLHINLISSQKNILRKLHTNIMINDFYGGICVEFERINNTSLLFLTFKLPAVLKIFYD